jgi:hypothetical protein
MACKPAHCSHSSPCVLHLLFFHPHHQPPLFPASCTAQILMKEPLKTILCFHHSFLKLGNRILFPDRPPMCPSKRINLLFPSAGKLVVITFVDGELPPWSMAMLSFNSTANGKGDAVLSKPPGHRSPVWTAVIKL